MISQTVNEQVLNRSFERTNYLNKLLKKYRIFNKQTVFSMNLKKTCFYTINKRIYLTIDFIERTILLNERLN